MLLIKAFGVGFAFTMGLELAMALCYAIKIVQREAKRR